MSVGLNIFCSEILKALESGEYPSWFNPHSGLCSNAMVFEMRVPEGAYASDDLKEIFKDSDFPFNPDNMEGYAKEKREFSLYKNEKRLAFLRKHATL